MGGGYARRTCCIPWRLDSFNEAAARGRRIPTNIAENRTLIGTASMRPPPVGGGYAAIRTCGKTTNRWLQ